MQIGQAFGSREICDVVFKAKTEVKIGDMTFKPGQPVLYIDTAKTSTLEGAASTVYAQGGKGNPRLVAWEGERTVTFTVEDALISPLSFSMLTGAGIRKAGDDPEDRIMVHTTFDLPILDGGKVKIDLDTAGADHDIVINDDAPVFGMIMDDNGCGVIPVTIDSIATDVTGPTPNDGVYTISRQQPLEIVFGGADKYVGHTLRVDCYCQKTSGATEMIIDAKNFAGNYYVEASTLWRDQNGEDYPMEIIIPNVKIQSNFTFSMAATGDPSTFTFTMDAFPAYPKFNKTKKAFATMQLIGEDSLLPDVADDATEVDSSKPLEYAILSAVPGVEPAFDSGVILPDYAADPTGATPDPMGIKVARLGNNLRTVIDRANIDFYGNLNKISNWTTFSKDAADLSGYYFPVTLTASEPGLTLINYPKGQANTNNPVKALAFEGDKLEWLVAVDPESPVIEIELANGKDPKAEDYVSEKLTLDFSKVNCK